MKFHVFKNGLRYDANADEIRWKFYCPEAVWSPWDDAPVGKTIKHIDPSAVRYRVICRNGNGLRHEPAPTIVYIYPPAMEPA